MVVILCRGPRVGRAFAIAVLLVGFAGSAIAASRVENRIKRDELAIDDGNSPHMVLAMRKARETLPGFLALSRAPQPTMSVFSVKVAVPTPQGAEYFWVGDFKLDGARYAGRINNTPRWATWLKEGAVITFLEKEIVDWMYLDGRTVKGNFTFCALMKNEPKKEAAAMIRKFNMDCRFLDEVRR